MTRIATQTAAIVAAYRDAVVARRDDQGVLELAACLQLLHQHAQPRVHRQALAKIISRILANLVNIRQKIWQPALEIVWFEAPERFA